MSALAAPDLWIIAGYFLIRRETWSPIGKLEQQLDFDSRTQHVTVWVRLVDMGTDGEWNCYVVLH